MKTWTAAIEDIGNLPEKVVRGTLIGMGTKIIKRSPVDTGRFRGNWQFTIGRPAQGQIASGGVPTSELVSASNSWQSGQTFYITNNLPYGERLEYGWSKQAPQGMVRLTLGEYRQVLKTEADKL